MSTVFAVPAHRLFIDGVRTPIMAERLVRHGAQATLEHSLPFLAIGTAVVDEAGRSYVIRGVDLQLTFAGVPRLVVDLEPETIAMTRRESTPARNRTVSYERRAAAYGAPSAIAIPHRDPPAPSVSTASTSTRLLASAPPALHRGVAMELTRPDFLDHPIRRFFRRLRAELRSVWHELAVDLGLRTESRRVR